jgi:hypothetical protein
MMFIKVHDVTPAFPDHQRNVFDDVVAARHE